MLNGHCSKHRRSAFILVELLVALTFVSSVLFVLWQAFDGVLSTMADLDRKEAAYQKAFIVLEELTAGVDIGEDLKVSQEGHLWTVMVSDSEKSSSEISRMVFPEERGVFEKSR